MSEIPGDILRKATRAFASAAAAKSAEAAVGIIAQAILAERTRARESAAKRFQSAMIVYDISRKKDNAPA